MLLVIVSLSSLSSCCPHHMVPAVALSLSSWLSCWLWCHPFSALAIILDFVSALLWYCWWLSSPSSCCLCHKAATHWRLHCHHHHSHHDGDYHAQYTVLIFILAINLDMSFMLYGSHAIMVILEWSGMRWTVQRCT